MYTKNNGHPFIQELKNNFLKGKITRGEFMRKAALLGASMSAIGFFLSGCSPTELEEGETTPDTPSTPSGIIRGGSLSVAMRVQRIDHPARLSWTAPANILRHVME